MAITIYTFFIFLMRNVMSGKKWNKYFTIIASFGLIILSTFRTIEIGTDTHVYIDRYLIFDNLSFQEVIDFHNNYLSKDIMFYLFSKMISMFGFSERGYIMVLSAIYIFGVSQLIIKKSPFPFLSLLLFISLGYFTFSFTGLRQTLAMSVLIPSYRHIKDRAIGKFVLYVLIASLFHSSALIFVIVYPISKIKMRFMHFWGIIITIVLSLFFDNLIRQLIGLVAWNETLEVYLYSDNTLNYSGFFIQLSLLLFCLFYKNKIGDQVSDSNILLNLQYLGVIFHLLSTTIAEFFRIGMYFSIFSIVLVPIAINSESNIRVKRTIYFIIVLLLILYLIVGG